MNTAREQFQEDFLLVMMNDQESYFKLLRMAEKADGDRYELAHLIAVWYEYVVEEVVRSVRGRGVIPLLVNQIMDYWDSDTFIGIADQVLVSYKESRLKTEEVNA